MKNVYTKYDLLKQQVGKLLKEDQKIVKAKLYFNEFEKTFNESYGKSITHAGKNENYLKKSNSDVNSDSLFIQLEKFIREGNEYTPDQIIVRGLAEAAKATKSKLGFFYFTGKSEFNFGTKVWPGKNKPESITKLDNVLNKYSKQVKQSGLSLIQNNIHEIIVLSPSEKLVLKNYVIVPIIDSGNIVAMLILANKPGDYYEKELSHIMFLSMNIWMMAEHKYTEEALKLSENKFRLLSQHISDFIWSCDLDGRFSYINLPASHATGYTPEELKRLTIYDLLSGQDKALFQTNFKKRLEQEKKGVKTDSADYTVKYVRKDGSTFWVEVRLSPLRDEHGKLLGLAGVTRDVTQRLDAENNLKESEQRLREAVSAKDKFLTIIAHDLKSPFSALVGLSEVLLEKHSKMNSESREEIIRSIYQSTLRTYNLLENLLDWSGMQTGRKIFRPEVVEIAPLAREIADLFAEMIKRKNIEFSIFGDKTVKAFADTDMISTVFRNLLSNALKYTPNNGSITIHFHKDYSPTHLKVTFADTGVGIAAKDIDKLFRIDASVSTPGLENEKGTGLGLVLCKEFIEKNGGTIHVQSKLKVGTSFIFTLKKNA